MGFALSVGVHHLLEFSVFISSLSTRANRVFYKMLPHAKVHTELSNSNMLCFFIAGCWCLADPNMAYAQDTDVKLTPPESAFGVGVGFIAPLHIGYQRWVAEQTSIEVGFAPLILHNEVAVGVTQHIGFAPAASKEHSLIVSGHFVGMATVLACNGVFCGGLGFRVGYEVLAQRYGFSVAGGLIASPTMFISPDIIDPYSDFYPEVRLTVWRVKRTVLKPKRGWIDHHTPL